MKQVILGFILGGAGKMKQVILGFILGGVISFAVPAMALYRSDLRGIESSLSSVVNILANIADNVRGICLMQNVATDFNTRCPRR